MAAAFEHSARKLKYTSSGIIAEFWLQNCEPVLHGYLISVYWNFTLEIEQNLANTNTDNE